MSARAQSAAILACMTSQSRQKFLNVLGQDQDVLRAGLIVDFRSDECGYFTYATQLAVSPKQLNLKACMGIALFIESGTRSVMAQSSPPMHVQRSCEYRL